MMVKNIMLFLRQQLLFAFILLAAINCMGQGCDETIFTDFSLTGFKGNLFNESFMVRQDNEKLYAIKTGSMGFLIQDIANLDTIWMYDMHTEKISSISISQKGLKKKHRKDNASDFYVDNDYIYIMGHEDVLVYKKEATQYVYYSFVKLDYMYSYILGKIDDDLIFYQGYNFHPSDQKERVIISKFSTKNLSVVASIFPDFKGIELTHSNKRFCALHKNTILLAQPFADTIAIYNANLEQKGKIALRHIIDDTIQIDYKEFSTEEVQKVLMQDYLYNRNIKVDVFGDTLLVLYKKKFQNFRGNVYFDVYVSDNNNWQVADTGKYLSFNFDSTIQVTPNTWYVPYIINNNPLVVYNGFMYELINQYLKVDEPISFKAFNALIDEAAFEDTYKAALMKQPIKCLLMPHYHK